MYIFFFLWNYFLWRASFYQRYGKFNSCNEIYKQKLGRLDWVDQVDLQILSRQHSADWKMGAPRRKGSTCMHLMTLLLSITWQGGRAKERFLGSFGKVGFCSAVSHHLFLINLGKQFPCSCVIIIWYSEDNTHMGTNDRKRKREREETLPTLIYE